LPAEIEAAFQGSAREALAGQQRSPVVARRRRTDGSSAGRDR
jgi:hypothetical protein